MLFPVAFRLKEVVSEALWCVFESQWFNSELHLKILVTWLRKPCMRKSDASLFWTTPTCSHELRSLKNTTLKLRRWHPNLLITVQVMGKCSTVHDRTCQKFLQLNKDKTEVTVFDDWMSVLSFNHLSKKSTWMQTWIWPLSAATKSACNPLKNTSKINRLMSQQNWKKFLSLLTYLDDTGS